MNFDNDRLAYLRTEARIYHLDLTRAKLRSSGDGGYVVHLDPPLFDLAPLLENVPRTVPARSAAGAEGELLTWLLTIQRAERQKVRLGTKCGWDTCAINRRPLTEDEIAEHKQRVKRVADTARLQEQLTEALEKTAKNASIKKAHDELEQRYGMSAMQPANEGQAPAVNAPKRKGAKK